MAMKMRMHDLEESRRLIRSLLGKLGYDGPEAYCTGRVLESLGRFLDDNAELFSAYVPGSRALSKDGCWHVEEEWRRRMMGPDQLLAFLVPGGTQIQHRLAEKTFRAWSATNRLGKEAELRWLDETEARRARLAYAEAWDAEPPEGDVLLVRWEYYHPSMMEAMGH